MSFLDILKYVCCSSRDDLLIAMRTDVGKSLSYDEKNMSSFPCRFIA